ncbi:uncharacterized protein B0H64DRAFT_393192 [Chaetomium fimeti]|uniref:Uncharacterized protein n=1 Tax=Chaetomium fimeti TaxID=1854472 RepID=A0AAE0HJX9_9PEZI|nr:hypothetical protein B0H64DRAFT_393192 [Chaetomium fimeti]
MPPPNTPEEGLATTALRPSDEDNFRVSSPSSAMAHASQTTCSSKLDYQNIEYIDPVDETLLCPVCKTAFHSPITTPCGHTFCAGCINRALETQSTCPIDRLPVDKTRDYVRLPLIIKDQLDRLQVKCPNRGCDYQCSREHIEGHYERRCEHTPVQCPDPTCSQRVPRRDAAPENGCMHQEVTCEFCEERVTFVEIISHQTYDCRGAIVNCPDCKEHLSRHCLAKHQAQDCPESNTQCKWHSAGCKVADKRRVVQEHEQSGCPSEVVGRLMQKQDEDRKIIDELAGRLTKFELAQSKKRERHTQRTRVGGSNVANTSRSATGANVPGITLNNNAPPLFPDSTDDGAEGGSPEDYLLAQFERLEAQVELLRKQSLEMDARQSHIILQHATHFSEHLTEIGNKVGIVNMHMSWLMSLQRQNVQQRAGSTAGPSNTGMSHGNVTSGGGRPPPPRETSGWVYSEESPRNSEGRSEPLHRL